VAARTGAREHDEHRGYALMAYVGQTRSRVLIAQLAHLGIGECVV
jgi:hypothetical protein